MSAGPSAKQVALSVLVWRDTRDLRGATYGLYPQELYHVGLQQEQGLYHVQKKTANNALPAGDFLCY